MPNELLSRLVPRKKSLLLGNSKFILVETENATGKVFRSLRIDQLLAPSPLILLALPIFYVWLIAMLLGLSL